MPRHLLTLHPQFLFETDEVFGGEADSDAPADAPVDSPEAEANEGTPATGQDEAVFDDGINLDDVPEYARKSVEEYRKQTQAAYTRQRQADAERVREQLGEAEEALSIYERLNDADQVEDVFNELAERYQLELADPESGDPEVLSPLEQELKDARDRIEQLEGKETSREEQATQVEIRDHVYGAIDDYADSLGIPDDQELPEPITRAILAATLSAPQVNGLPDVSAGIEVWKAAEAATIERYLASKNRPSPDLAGSSGVSEMDMSTPEGRRAAAVAVAGRHY